MCTVPLLLQLLLVHGNTGFGFLLTHPRHPSLLCHSPGRLCWPLCCQAAQLALVLALHKDHQGLFHRTAPQPLSLPLIWPLASHLLRVGRLLPLPQHTTEPTWQQSFVELRPLKVKLSCKQLLTTFWSNY